MTTELNTENVTENFTSTMLYCGGCGSDIEVEFGKQNKCDICGSLIEAEVVQ